MHKQRVGVVIAASAGALGSFLPWVHAPIVGSINGTQGDGKITLALFAIALIFALFGDRATELPAGRWFGVILSGGLAGLLGIYKIVDFGSGMPVDNNNPFAKAMAQAVGVDIGLYLVAIAGVAVPIAAVAMTKKGSGGGS